MKRLFYILSITFLNLFLIYGQDQNKVPQVIPSSPEAASLGKYGAFPVGYYTGVPSINIPLYELKAGEITLPISLSYHASGIRVDDIASSVGLGWSLNAGGCISVETKGRPDIIPAKYEEYNGSTYLGNVPYPRIKSLTFKDFLETTDISTKISLNNLNNLYIDHPTDIEPDVYNYNIAGFSGQFIISENNTIKFLKNSDGLKASFNSTDTVFMIIDKSGKQYIFKNKEITKTREYRYGLYLQTQSGTIINNTPSFVTDGPYGDGKESYTSWFLSKIIGENKLDTLSFVYESNIQKYATRINGTIISYRVENNPGIDDGTNSLISLEHWQLPTMSSSFSRSYIEQQVWNLKEIRHNRTPIIAKFVMSNRIDLLGAKKLDKLTISYQNEIISDWRFGYDYFSSTWQKQESSDNYLISTNPLGKRLKLSSVQKFGKTELDKENPYQFEYYFDNATAKLPYRNATNGFDHWGYFNAELTTTDELENVLKSFPATNSSGFSIVPQYGIGPILTSNLSNPNYSIKVYVLNAGGMPPLTDGGNRQPSPVYAKALSLKSIQFPTGGKTTFEYENHQFSAICNDTYASGMNGGIRIKRMIDKTNNDSILKDYSYDGGVVYSKPNYLFNRYCPTFETIVGREVLWGCYDFNNYSDVSAYSYGEMIGYRQITENIIDSKTSQQIKTVYNYNSANDYSAGYYERAGLIFKRPFKQTNGLFQNANQGGVSIIRPFDGLILGKNYRRGLLTEKYQYSNDKLIKSEFFHYDYIAGDSIFGNRVKPFEKPMWYWSIYGITGEDAPWYYFDIYFHETGKSFLKRKTEKLYDMNGANPVIKSTLYEYDTTTELVKCTTDSLGTKTIKKQFIYPSDYVNFPMYQGKDNPIGLMKQTNRIANPIEQKTFVNDKLISNYITPYNYVPGTDIIKPAASYKLDTQSPITDFTALSSGDGNAAYIIDPRMSQEMSYTYYSDGNIKEIVNNKTGTTTTYLWSYKGQYPVAEVVNATLIQIQGSLGSTFSTDLSAKSEPTMEDMAKLNMIKNYFLSALVTVYTYKPLVGMVSKTDPRGVTTNYTYDTFNRLYLARDNNKNIVGKYNYAYQNQTTANNTNGGYAPISASIQLSSSSYLYGATGTASLTVSGGTGNYTYNWYVKDNAGNVLTSTLNTTATTYSFTCNKTTLMTVQCIITDAQTGSTFSTSRNISPICFTYFTQTGNQTNNFFYNIAQSVIKNSTTVSGYLIFYSDNIMNPGYSYLVGNFSLGLRPTVTQTMLYDTSGRTLQFTFYPDGRTYVKIVSGAAISAIEAVYLTQFSFNLYDELP